MSVDLALFRGDELLWRGTVTITKTRTTTEFALEDSAILIISHEFALPACSLSLQLLQKQEPEPVVEAGVAMGVHDSDDWESVALGTDHTLGFFCRSITTLRAER